MEFAQLKSINSIVKRTRKDACSSAIRIRVMTVYQIR